MFSSHFIIQEQNLWGWIHWRYFEIFASQKKAEASFFKIRHLDHQTYNSQLEFPTPGWKCKILRIVLLFTLSSIQIQKYSTSAQPSPNFFVGVIGLRAIIHWFAKAMNTHLFVAPNQVRIRYNFWIIYHYNYKKQIMPSSGCQNASVLTPKGIFAF